MSMMCSLQEIKKKKGIKDEVQLTSKQKELMHAQLEKESQIRKRLKEVTVDDIFFASLAATRVIYGNHPHCFSYSLIMNWKQPWDCWTLLSRENLLV